jgi:hypothetical protein
MTNSQRCFGVFAKKKLFNSCFVRLPLLGQRNQVTGKLSVAFGEVVYRLPW